MGDCKITLNKNDDFLNIKRIFKDAALSDLSRWEGKMYKRIVLAYDGSDSAKAALAHTKELAQICGAKVYVVNAFQHIPNIEGDDWVQKAVAAGTARGEVLVSEAIDDLHSVGVDAVGEVLEGPPAKAIIRVATTREADLIVMGNRGYNIFTEMFLGSVSLHVLTHSDIPVLILRA